MDAEHENWLSSVTLERLRARGWRGDVAQYHRAARELGFDPLDDLDKAHAKVVDGGTDSARRIRPR